jgi:rhomboid protease GluP
VVLIALNIVFFVMEEARGGSENLSVLMQLGAIYQPAIQSGQYYRLVTAMFLHIGLSHLASNMYALFIIGSTLERVYGHDRFIIVYLVSGLCGSILSAISIPAGIVAAGASGAILGSLAALIVLQLRFSRVSLGIGLGSAILSLSYNILSGFVPSSGIDNAAHLGGAMAGALLSLFIAPSAVFLDHVGQRGTRLIEAESPEGHEPASVIVGQQSPTQQARPRRVKSEMIGLLLVVLVVTWAASPVLIRSPAQLLVLTSTGYGGRFALRLQNFGPWPMVVRGYWRFSPPITWSGGGPASSFTLIPFGVYTFEYMTYCTGAYCPGSGIAPYVTFTGDVTLLYRTYQVEIRSINYGR